MRPDPSARPVRRAWSRHQRNLRASERRARRSSMRGRGSMRFMTGGRLAARGPEPGAPPIRAGRGLAHGADSKRFPIEFRHGSVRCGDRQEMACCHGRVGGPARGCAPTPPRHLHSGAPHRGSHGVRLVQHLAATRRERRRLPAILRSPDTAQRLPLSQRPDQIHPPRTARGTLHRGLARAATRHLEGGFTSDEPATVLSAPQAQVRDRSPPAAEVFVRDRSGQFRQQQPRRGLWPGGRGGLRATRTHLGAFRETTQERRLGTSGADGRHAVRRPRAPLGLEARAARTRGTTARRHQARLSGLENYAVTSVPSMEGRIPLMASDLTGRSWCAQAREATHLRRSEPAENGG